MTNEAQLAAEAQNLADRLFTKSNWPEYSAVDREFFRLSLATVQKLRESILRHTEAA